MLIKRHFFGKVLHLWDIKITFENLFFWKIFKIFEKIASHTGETLCQSFETSSGTITRITWSKTREMI